MVSRHFRECLVLSFCINCRGKGSLEVTYGQKCFACIVPDVLRKVPMFDSTQRKNA